jgi:hypothetical protein
VAKANDFGSNFEPISGPAIQPGFWLLFNGFSTASQRLLNGFSFPRFEAPIFATL